MNKNLRVFSIFLIFIQTFTIVLICCFPFLTESSKLIYEGDFICFYAAGKLVLDGQFLSAYDNSVMAALQNTYWPSLKGSFYMYAYPPYSSVLYAPFALFSPMVAKLLWVLFLYLCNYLSSLLLGRITKIDHIVIFALIIWLPTNVLSSLAGQNTAIITFLISATFYLLHNKQENAFTLGVIIGLITFKPHFGLAFIICFLIVLVFKRREVFLSFTFGLTIALGVFYLIAASLAGVDWILGWLRYATEFSIKDHSFNSHLLISYPPYLKLFFENYLGITLPAIVISYFLVPLFLGFFLIFTNKEISLIKTSYLSVFICVFLSPHTLLYDLGILLPFVIIYIFQNTNYCFRTYLYGILSLYLILGISVVFRESLGSFYTMLLISILWACTLINKPYLNKD